MSDWAWVVLALGAGLLVLGLAVIAEFRQRRRTASEVELQTIRSIQVPGVEFQQALHVAKGEVAELAARLTRVEQALLVNPPQQRTMPRVLARPLP